MLKIDFSAGLGTHLSFILTLEFVAVARCGYFIFIFAFCWRALADLQFQSVKCGIYEHDGHDEHLARRGCLERHR